MKLHAFLILIYLFSVNASAQNIEIAGGLNRNNYYDFQKNEGHFNSKYTPGFGYSVSVSVSEIKIDTVTIRLSLRLDNYRGAFEITDGGLGGGSTTKAEVERTSLGLTFYPVNLKFFKKRLAFDFGAEFNYLLKSKTSGYKSSWSITGSYSYMNIENDSVKINSNYSIGLTGRLGYDIKIAENWFVAPQYKFYFGLLSDFTKSGVRTFRSTVEIGIVRKIK